LSKDGAEVNSLNCFASPSYSKSQTNENFNIRFVSGVEVNFLHDDDNMKMKINESEAEEEEKEGKESEAKWSVIYQKSREI
jgi:hypothetical protein